MEIEALVRHCVDKGFCLHCDLGPGLLESADEALRYEGLWRDGLVMSRQQSVPIRHDGIIIDNGVRYDLLVEDKLPTEIKSTERHAPVHAKQVLTYLRLMDLRIGLLMNVGMVTFKDAATGWSTTTFEVRNEDPFASQRLRAKPIMDNLTHSLVGALIGQAGLKRKTGLAMPALIIGANLPDVDAACFFWLEGVEHLGFRRGITHGPPALVLLPLVLAGLLYGFDRWQAKRGKRPEKRLPVHFGWLYALAFIGCLTHPALDWLNVYGIRLLEPFSSRWFYGDVLFIIDVWLWALMGFATWFSLRREKRGGKWRRPARVAIAAALAYIGLNGAATWHTEHNHADTPTGNEIVIASPPPLQSWRRDVISGGNGFYAVNGEVLPGVPLGRCDLAGARRGDPQVAAMLKWSRTPFVVPTEDGRFMLNDARYYDPLSRGRFGVSLPAGTCTPSAAALAGE